MRLTLVRNATLLIELAGVRVLVDPLLADAGAYPPIGGGDGPRNPLVPLPAPAESIVDGVGVVVVTHLHNDHFDRVAAELLRKDVPVLCQPGDEEALGQWGFRDVTPVADTASVGGLTLVRTSGRHGTGAAGERLGPVSGLVLSAPGEPAVYVAGDTIWCPEVAEALERHRPAVTVVNAGGARLGDGGPIVMDVGDVRDACAAAPWTSVVAVHLEALDHCPVTRAELRAAGLPVLVPEDGETLVFD